MTDIRVTAVDVQVAGTVDANPRLLGQSLEVLGSSIQPGLEVTQFNVDVAGTMSGVLHLGRMYMEVLSQLVAPREIDLDITNIIVLNSLSYSGLVIRDEENVLSFTTDADVTLFRSEQPVTTSLTFTQEASNTILKALYPVSQDLAFTQLVGCGQPRRVTTTSSVEVSGSSIYIGPHWYELTSSLEFDNVIRIPEVIMLPCSNALSMSQAIVIHGKRLIAAENTLEIAIFSDTHIKARSLTDQIDMISEVAGTASMMLYNELELEHEVIKGRYNIEVDNELEFGQLIHINPITIGSGPRDRISLPIQEVSLEQTVRNSISSLVAENILEVAEHVIIVGPLYISATSITQWTENEYTIYGEPYTVFYGLQDSATVVIKPSRSSITKVGLEQLVSGARIKAGAVSLVASNTLEIDSGTPSITYLEVINELELESDANTKHGFSENDIDFSSVVTYNTNFSARLASNQLDLVSSFFAVPQHFSLCDYSPFMGSTTDPAPPQNILKNQPNIDPNRRGVTLFYPWESPTVTLNLRGPDLGNRNRLEFQRINRETRGGTLIIWADPIWPKNERLVLNFSGLTETEGQNTLDFITQSLGKEIGFTDWEGNTVYGIIVTPSEPLVRNGRRSLSLGLEIEISHSVITGNCTSNLSFSDTTIFNRDREYNVKSSIDFGLVLDYN